jgi:hypothetical protein
MTKTYKILLILLILFSFLIRLRNLDSNPYGFFCDEASAGIDAAGILKTGKDQHGDKFPLFFKGFNFDNVGPYEIYPMVPSIKLFGLNETAVRLPAVIGSCLEIFVFFFILSKFIPIPFALIGTFFLSICPWYFHISRISMGEYYSWTLLTSLSLLFLFKKKYYLYSLFIGLACYSYSPARMVSPIFFIFVLATILLQKKIKIGIKSLVIFLIVLIPFIYFHLTDVHSLNRMKDTVAVDQKLPQKFINKYLLHFSDKFLFTKGDTDFPGQFIRRHSIAGMGLFFPFQRVTIIIGLIWLIFQFIKKKNINYLYIIFLLLIFPVPDSLTIPGTPYSTRSYLGVIPLSIISSFGIYQGFLFFQKIKLLNQKTKKILYCSLIFLLGIISLKSLFYKFDRSPLTTSDYWGWQYGPKDIIKYFSENQNNYDQTIMTGSFNGAHIFFPFYAPDNCRKCVLGDIKNQNPKIRQLFALRPEEISLKYSELNIKKILYYPDKTPAFIIFEIK